MPCLCLWLGRAQPVPARAQPVPSQAARSGKVRHPQAFRGIPPSRRRQACPAAPDNARAKVGPRGATDATECGSPACPVVLRPVLGRLSAVLRAPEAPACGPAGVRWPRCRSEWHSAPCISPPSRISPAPSLRLLSPILHAPTPPAQCSPPSPWTEHPSGAAQSAVRMSVSPPASPAALAGQAARSGAAADRLACIPRGAGTGPACARNAACRAVWRGARVALADGQTSLETRRRRAPRAAG